MSGVAGTGPQRQGRRAQQGWLTPAALFVLLAGTLWVPVTLVRAAPAARAGTAPAVRVPGLDPGLALRGAGEEPVIIQADSVADVPAATTLVRSVGGVVGTALPVVNGFAARVPADRLVAVASSPSVRAVTANRLAHFDALSYGGVPVASNFVSDTQASTAWNKSDYGQGVGVAVLDTGISPMDDVKGRVVYGPDLSGEGTLVDTYGHGTVMGALIGGNGTDSLTNPAGAYTGVAPQTELVSVKVAGANGTVDVSTILQGMHWISAYASEFNIRVLSLSFGVPSTQDPTYDPLDYAVERLWNQGIAVVVAAGNAGPSPQTITKPGDDPMVITVGAYDDSNNTIPAWSSRGPTAQGVDKPDVVAPGRTLIAQRSFGSTVEVQNPLALVFPSYIKGSGTSEATAVVAGDVALLLSMRPTLTPDQVKHLLVSQASPISGYTSADEGAGRVQIGGALNASAGPAQWQTSHATGLGSIEASRGGADLQTVCPGQTLPTVIQGEIDVRCEAWNPQNWTGTSWTGTSWTGTSWTGGNWTGTSWTGTSWTGGTWTGTSWTGGTWTGGSWQGTSWTGTSWTGSSWTGTSWTGTSWTGTSWTGTSWTGTSWTATAWTGSSWTSAGWGDDFMTAFWGDHPRRGQHVPGEFSPGQPSTALRQI